MTFIVFLGNLLFYSWSIYPQNCGNTRNEVLLFMALEQIIKQEEINANNMLNFYLT